jgi:hypothetical protein
MIRAEDASELAAGRGSGAARAGRGSGPAKRLPRAGADAESLIFAGEMYGLQLDHLARLVGGSQRSATAAVSRWTRAGWADSDQLGRGLRWIWLTKAGLAACGLPYTATVPAASQLAHLRAVTAIRLALAGTEQFAMGQAYWRSERRLRARFGRRIALREHVPDGEVHWPEVTGLSWAGECWAIEAELTPKTVAKTTTIMRELLTRTGDYGCATDGIIVAGQPPRHARAIYLCSPRALQVVARARDALGELAGRIEIRLLPPDAQWRPDQ